VGWGSERADPDTVHNLYWILKHMPQNNHKCNITQLATALVDISITKFSVTRLRNLNHRAQSY
jgi:hypothetical protein